jgi:hypothetical protein
MNQQSILADVVDVVALDFEVIDGFWFIQFDELANSNGAIEAEELFVGSQV